MNDRPAEQLAIFKKGKEIFEIANRICDLIPEENKELLLVKSEIISDAATLYIKVAGAEAAELYDLKMEAAAIIRKSANDLSVKNHILEMFGFEHTGYFSIIKGLLEEFRLLFIDWVNSFDKWNYVIDRWGLFNPPGIGPFDKDPDANIPFDRDDDSL